MAGTYDTSALDSQNLARCADALETIAGVLQVIVTEPETTTCTHPESEREVRPGSVMGNLTYRCKACGEPCREPGT